jgi:hypothetical protein
VLEDAGVPIDDPVLTFSELDTDQQGSIAFKTMTAWAVDEHLAVDVYADDFDFEMAADVARPANLPALPPVYVTPIQEKEEPNQAQTKPQPQPQAQSQAQVQKPQAGEKKEQQEPAAASTAHVSPPAANTTPEPVHMARPEPQLVVQPHVVHDDGDVHHVIAGFKGGIREVFSSYAQDGHMSYSDYLAFASDYSVAQSLTKQQLSSYFGTSSYSEEPELERKQLALSEFCECLVRISVGYAKKNGLNQLSTRSSALRHLMEVTLHLQEQTPSKITSPQGQHGGQPAQQQQLNAQQAQQLVSKQQQGGRRNSIDYRFSAQELDDVMGQIFEASPFESLISGDTDNFLNSPVPVGKKTATSMLANLDQSMGPLDVNYALPNQQAFTWEQPGGGGMGMQLPHSQQHGYKQQYDDEHQQHDGYNDLSRGPDNYNLLHSPSFPPTSSSPLHQQEQQPRTQHDVFLELVKKNTKSGRMSKTPKTMRKTPSKSSRKTPSKSSRKLPSALSQKKQTGSTAKAKGQLFPTNSSHHAEDEESALERELFGLNDALSTKMGKLANQGILNPVHAPASSSHPYHQPPASSSHYNHSFSSPQLIQANAHADRVRAQQRRMQVEKEERTLRSVERRARAAKYGHNNHNRNSGMSFQGQLNAKKKAMRSNAKKPKPMRF